jgi:hypothetical protein
MVQSRLNVLIGGLIRSGERDPARSDCRQQRAIHQSEQTREGFRIGRGCGRCRRMDLVEVFNHCTFTIATTRQVPVKVRAPRMKLL